MNNNYANNIALLLQALSLEILFKDYNNSDLMQELRIQDEQYLKKIINQNEEILKLLKERSELDGRKVNNKN
jgi:uncharacterized ubiquitin-like protein YukD